MNLGFHGNLFGGKLLSWVDAAVTAYAMEVCLSEQVKRKFNESRTTDRSK